MRTTQKNKKEERKLLVDLEAKEVAKHVIESEDGIIVNVKRKGVNEKTLNGIEQCLLNKYCIKTINIDIENVAFSVHMFTSFNEKKQEKILKQIREKEIPEILELLKEVRKAEEAMKRSAKLMAESFVEYLLSELEAEESSTSED